MIEFINDTDGRIVLYYFFVFIAFLLSVWNAKQLDKERPQWVEKK